jgi:septal ring factor EnvC (AmiA/AmiB activator)
MTRLNVANLSEFATQIDALHESGISDVALSETSGSHVRNSRETSLVESPLRDELAGFCSEVFGEKESEKLRSGGRLFATWNGATVTAIVTRDGGPYHVGLHLSVSFL